MRPEFQPDGRRSADVGDGPIRRAFITGYVQFDYLHLTAKGEPLPVETTLIRVPKGEGYTVVGYMRDLRDQDAAARYAKAKNEFLASVSHEIRTPLNAIQSMAYIANEIKSLNENQQNLVNQGMLSVKLLTAAIETILDFSKLDTGQLSLETVEFSVRELVSSISEMVRKDAEEKSLCLRTSVDSDVPQRVMGDSVRLQQVLLNIVTNAIKFTETGGVDICVYRDNNDRSNVVPLIFEIRDTGIGIDDEHKDILFKPLYANDTAYTRKHGGMGMGLAVSEGLARLMGGKITFESQVGKGSVFRVHISLSVPAKDAGARKPRKIADRDVLRGMRVLVAEDNKINQMVMEELLSSVGVKVTLADNGLKVLERLQTDVFDLVLMDIQMPEMDGLTAAVQIRRHSHFNDLPILAMTANAGAEHLAESLSAGMNDHLTKPVDVEKLYSALKKWGGR